MTEFEENLIKELKIMSITLHQMSLDLTIIASGLGNYLSEDIQLAQRLDNKLKQLRGEEE